MVSSLPGCPLRSCQSRAISFRSSSSGGITSLSMAMVLHPRCSCPWIIWIGSCSVHCFMISLWWNWASTMRCSNDPSELASKIFRNANSGMRANSRSSSVMSAPFGHDNASAGVLVFPWTCMILKL